jgi:hypothetical protein
MPVSSGGRNRRPEAGGNQEAINQEGIMKRVLIAESMLAALMLTIGAFAVHTKAEAKNNERATIEFTQTVKLLNVFLKGEYLVVHDEALMAKGEDCTYLYDRAGKLVVSFHCTPVERKKSDRFRVVTRRLDPSGLSEIIEIQFAGSTEAHQIN